MDLDLFDTHCDTAYAMFKNNEWLTGNSLHISLERASTYRRYLQCMAVWSDNALSDDAAYATFGQVYAYLRSACEKAPSAMLCRSYTDIEAAHAQGKYALLLTVEDARLLGGDIARLDTLRDSGVRMLTFQWAGETCIGGGFDTDLPLSPFGLQLADKCAEYGIIADISHACERTAIDIIERMSQNGGGVIATHSNSYSVYPHKRNLTDGLLDALIAAGGIVGISLAPQHLSADSRVTSETVLAHIEHYSERAGIGHICLGCDLDGIDSTPEDIRNLREVENIAECMLRHNYSEQAVRAVFSENARRFLRDNL